MRTGNGSFNKGLGLGSRKGTSRRMARHIRDLNVESTRDFKLYQAARWSNNKENDQKMADNAYLFRVYVLHTCVS